MNSNDTIPISVIIPTLNEERNLERCLKCLDEFEKIYIVDSGSTDGTIEIAKKFHVEVIPFHWNGHFPKKRNWFLRNHEITTPWVFFLDADEYVTPEFKKELRERISEPVAGFEVYYTVGFMGRRMKHFFTHKLPLFRVGAGEYERIEEDHWSNFDMEIHEHPVLTGKIGRIHATIIHEDDKGLHAYIAKHNEYSSWEAKRYFALKKSGHFEQLLFRQKIKYHLLSSYFFAPLYFIWIYFFQLGFLDGENGLVFSLLKKQYFSQIKFKITTLQRQES